MNIIVIYGSKSCEHEISIITAKQVLAAIDSLHKVYAVYIDRSGVWRYLKNPDVDYKEAQINVPEAVILPYAKSLFIKKRFGLKKLADIDAAVLALHGVNGEDGTVQGLLRLAEIPFTSSGVSASALTMDKLLTKDILKGIGAPVIDAVGLTGTRTEKDLRKIKEISNEIDYPVIVKPSNLGSSIGIGIARNPEEFAEKALAAFEYDTRILYEKALKNFTEVNIAVYKYKGELQVSLAEKPLSAHDILTFDDKYRTFSKKESKRVFPFSHPLVNEMQSCAERVYSAVNASGIIRIDFLIENESEKFYVNEINSIPGSLAHYLFPEISFTELIDRLIENAIYEQKLANSLTFVFKTDILDLKGKQ